MTSQEDQLKLLVLSYNSDMGNKKEEYIKYFRMVSSFVISGGGGGGCGVLMAMMHVTSDKF